MFTWQAAGSFSSIADTAGNTWHDTGISLAAGGNSYRIYYAFNCIGNAANVVTVTLTAGSVYTTIVVYEISGADTSDPLNTTSTGSGTSTSIATGTLNVVASSEIICAYMTANLPPTTGGSGYTLVNFGITGDPTAYFSDEYHVVTSSEAATATCGNQSWAIVAASFKVLPLTSDWLQPTNQPVREIDKVVAY